MKIDAACVNRIQTRKALDVVQAQKLENGSVLAICMRSETS